MGKYFLRFLIFFIYYNTNSAYLTTQFGINGKSVELVCRHKSTVINIQWYKGTGRLSNNVSIYNYVTPVEFRDRLSITGNHANGEYHLTIATVKKTDEGKYYCLKAGDIDQAIVQLSIIEGPSQVKINNTSIDSKVHGVEKQDLSISCNAEGGDKTPDMILQIKNQNYTKSSQRNIEHTLMKVDRQYDGATVKCMAGYQGLSYFPETDTAIIYMDLKPFKPSISPDFISTEETKPLSVTCTSSGGRPKPTVKWSVDNTEITSQSTVESSTHDTATDTYTVKSKLTYIVDRNDNGKTLTCGFKNRALSNSYVSESRILDIKFSPSVSVGNMTYNLGDISRPITCNAYGNPATYSFSKWQHKSKYGTVIRTLDGNSILTLPTVPEHTRYQDTGEYVCTVSNAIKDKDGNLNQQASGFIVSQAPPVFLSGDQQIKLSQTKNDVKIQVNVYSVPKYSSRSWLKGISVISPSTKYTMTYNPAVFMDAFHGTEVQVDGYRLTLTIHSLEEQDFVNYTLRLSNGVGQTVEHLVVLISASPPGTPSNFSITDTTESTITLQWLPGFDGGHEQIFVIQYRVKNNHRWQDTVVPMTDYASNCQCSLSKSFFFTLTGLNSETLYEIRIYAENKFNRSHPSTIEDVTTNPMRQHLAKKDNGTLVGVAAGLSTVSIISIVINVIFTYKMLTDKRSPMKSASNVDSKDGRSLPDVYYNISDNAGDTDDESDREVQRYETLGMKDKPNEYDMCEPQQRDKSSDVLHSNAGQNYETLGTKDKPNVYEDLDENSKQSRTKLYSNTLI